MKKKSRYRLGHVSLERALSKLGICSRTVAHQAIKAGRVQVNDKTILDPFFSVHPEKAKISIDAQRVQKKERVVFLFHKPKGVVTTERDERHRLTVFDVLKNHNELEKLHGHMMAVGRLDAATTGLLLLTNDTRFADWMCDPKNKIPRTYLVQARGEVTLDVIERMKKGVQVDQDFLSFDQVNLLKSSGKESRLLVTLCEGKNREVRRLFMIHGHEVTALKRVSFGGFELGELALGEYSDVTLQANALMSADEGK